MTTRRDPKVQPLNHAEEASPSTRGDEGSDQPVSVDVPDDALTVDGAAGLDERYLRLAADFENFRRRKNQEVADRSRYASEDAARALLPVLDNLRRAVAHAADDGTAERFVSGLELVVREFEAALEKLGVEPIQAVGQPFDPSLHEAIGGEESADVDVDTVLDEVRPGYRLHDRLLRPSLVRVAHPATTPGKAT
jgi:molecular chaperone GrpE